MGRSSSVRSFARPPGRGGWRAVGDPARKAPTIVGSDRANAMMPALATRRRRCRTRTPPDLTADISRISLVVPNIGSVMALRTA